uniref:Deoxynucleoside kinase domain-containing protein n=1 Tax=Lygus hesperus TaxID=30085 RepID=A0A0K8TJV1_LYGHE
MTLLALSCRVVRLAGSASSRGISSKALREVKNKPAPYDWKNKNYPLWYSLLFDKTTSRFDENTKVIVVEGPVASGKTAFAKELANQLDMCHMEDVNMDTIYINPYGYDMRKLDPKMPEELKSFDESNFNRTPTHRNVAAFQAWMYRLRYAKYIDTLAHVLSTGQGVVLERCPWTDQVFTDTMAKHKYISREAVTSLMSSRKRLLTCS